MSAPVALEIIAGLLLFAAIFIPLERLFPIHRQAILRRGWSTDLSYYVVGCFVGHLSDSICIVAMLLLRSHLTAFVPLHAAVQPAWLQFVEVLLLADFLAYWFHRALHRNPLLWRFHQVHHSSEHMDWLANVRLHPVDKIMGDCFQFIPIMCLGFSAHVLLLYTIFLGLQGFLNHSNVRLNYGPLRWVITSPQFHHWHHCRDSSAYDRNFAPHLAVFDLLFGTARIPPANVMPDRYGVIERVPNGLWSQMRHPFGRISTTESPETATRPQAPS